MTIGVTRNCTFFGLKSRINHGGEGTKHNSTFGVPCITDYGRFLFFG